MAISAHYHVGKPEGEAMINYLLAQGADINGYVCGGQTIVMYALMSENTNEKTIQFLIDKGANLNKLRKEDMSNGWKESVFLYAFDSYKKKVKMKEIKLMVARGAKTVGDFVTWSFLNHCIFDGKNELAKYLLEQKLVSITDQGSEEEYGSNMNIAAGVGNLEMIDYMLKLGVKPETKATNGKNALDLAREKNQEKALKLLLTKKIEPADKAYMDLRNDPAYERVIFHNKKAENFSLPTPQGKTITFADYKGKVVLLNIWATWCLPCVLEMPNIHKLQTAIRQPNFKVVAVAIDAPDRKKNILDFLKENPSYKFDYAIDQNYEKMVYGYATTIPGTFLIDKNGNIVAEVKGKVDWSTEPYIKLIKTILAL